MTRRSGRSGGLPTVLQQRVYDSKEARSQTRQTPPQPLLDGCTWTHPNTAPTIIEFLKNKCCMKRQDVLYVAATGKRRVLPHSR
eukprot:5255965-Amphidinium_carterae.2